MVNLWLIIMVNNIGNCDVIIPCLKLWLNKVAIHFLVSKIQEMLVLLDC
jgi:hypothetical protein